jgi:predicted transcriptional regulator
MHCHTKPLEFICHRYTTDTARRCIALTTKPSNLTNPTIAEYAEHVGKHHDIYGETGRADVSKLLKDLGGVLAYEHDSESLHVRRRGDFTVFIPQFTSERRDRFTIAHELGHYFLHYLYPKDTAEKVFARGGRDRAETEANVFASSLLMPTEEFAAAFEEFDGDSWKLSVRFDVSPAAADVRAQVLGCVAARQPIAPLLVVRPHGVHGL